MINTTTEHRSLLFIICPAPQLIRSYCPRSAQNRNSSAVIGHGLPKPFIVKSISKKDSQVFLRPESQILCVTRFELATFWSVARRSIQLSYTHISSFNDRKTLYHGHIDLSSIFHKTDNIYFSKNLPTYSS